jgi:aryl-alcohol dehydrogenase-like predicted oxidoreductase
MDFRPLGRSGLRVSSLTLGTMTFGGGGKFANVGSTDVDGARRQIDMCLDAGINLFDTADVYSDGLSEEILGQALAGRRDEVLVATKARMAMGDGPNDAGLSRHHLIRSCEASLRRLGTDHIDIYQLHSPPRAVIAAGEFIPALDELKAQGKIRHYGIAADAANDLAEVDRHPSVTSLQLPFSVIDQSAAATVLPQAAADGVGVISRSCFAAGLLVGSRSEAELRQQTPDWQAILDFRAKADELGRPRRELALQFNLGTAPIAVTIVGMSTPKQLADIVREAAAPPLTDDERAALIGLGGAAR